MFPSKIKSVRNDPTKYTANWSREAIQRTTPLM